MSYYLKSASYNFVGNNEKYTRITEYKHLTGQICDSTTISYEYPTFIGEPFYPIPNSQTDLVYRKYLQRQKK